MAASAGITGVSAMLFFMFFMVDESGPLLLPDLFLQPGRKRVVATKIQIEMVGIFVKGPKLFIKN